MELGSSKIAWSLAPRKSHGAWLLENCIELGSSYIGSSIKKNVSEARLKDYADRHGRDNSGDSGVAWANQLMDMFDSSWKEFYTSHFHSLGDEKLMEFATLYPITPVYKKVLELLAPSAATLKIAQDKFSAWEGGLCSQWAIWQKNAEPNIVNNVNLQVLSQLITKHFITEPMIYDIVDTVKDLTAVVHFW